MRLSTLCGLHRDTEHIERKQKQSSSEKVTKEPVLENSIPMGKDQKMAPAIRREILLSILVHGQNVSGQNVSATKRIGPKRIGPKHVATKRISYKKCRRPNILADKTSRQQNLSAA
jgi:hypothetical protein